uniref:Uncharacterized protein n=1 Tax=Rhizophora mucronata TaxID=61149 RepID=A0A2P2N8P4_RHIMU
MFRFSVFFCCIMPCFFFH